MWTRPATAPVRRIAAKQVAGCWLCGPALPHQSSSYHHVGAPSHSPGEILCGLQQPEACVSGKKLLMLDVQRGVTRCSWPPACNWQHVCRLASAVCRSGGQPPKRGRHRHERGRPLAGPRCAAAPCRRGACDADAAAPAANCWKRQQQSANERSLADGLADCLQPESLSDSAICPHL